MCKFVLTKLSGDEILNATVPYQHNNEEYVSLLTITKHFNMLTLFINLSVCISTVAYVIFDM